jgi:hypothetical protein
MPKPEDHIMQFGMTNQLILSELTEIENRYGLDLRHLAGTKGDLDEIYYPQFDGSIRAEASTMSQHYETFYCLEKSIRQLIFETMQSEVGEDWWNNSSVPARIIDEVNTRIRKEADSAVTPRSEHPIDYTTFGELGEIIRKNWDVFGSLFRSQVAVGGVLSRLNALRGPIAHCSPLAEDEVLRLRLTVRDWFRLME